jgi:hypothetical protein
MKKTIKFMLDSGYDLRCGKHHGGIGYFACFYRQPEGAFAPIPQTNWTEGGHGLTLKAAIENAADIACHLPDAVAPGPEEFVEDQDW